MQQTQALSKALDPSVTQTTRTAERQLTTHGKYNKIVDCINLFTVQ